MSINKLTEKVIGSAIEVHSVLGPGLLESAYEQCLAKEFSFNKINFERQLSFPIDYNGCKVDCGYRVDFLIEDCLIVEIKSVDKISDVYKAQLLTYMKLMQIKTGLLINFNVNLLKDGLQRFVL